MKWTVKRADATVGYTWQATSPDCDRGPLCDCAWFLTWAEAIRYATKKAWHVQEVCS